MKKNHKLCKKCMNMGEIKPMHKPCRGNGCDGCNLKGFTILTCPTCKGASKNWR